MSPKPHTGFTLSELLIALGLLGVIAAFTIPKVLQSQQEAKFNSIAKESVQIMSGAFSAYSIDNSPVVGTGVNEFTPYINYVSVDSVSQIDYYYGSTFVNCSTGYPCLKLHNGAVLKPNCFLDGTSNNNAWVFVLDPDGVYSNTTTGSGKGIQLWLYTDGRITSRPYIDNPSRCSASNYSPVPNSDPPWFSWDN